LILISRFQILNNDFSFKGRFEFRSCSSLKENGENKRVFLLTPFLIEFFFATSCLLSLLKSFRAAIIYHKRDDVKKKVFSINARRSFATLAPKKNKNTDGANAIGSSSRTRAQKYSRSELNGQLVEESRVKVDPTIARGSLFLARNNNYNKHLSELVIPYAIERYSADAFP